VRYRLIHGGKSYDAKAIAGAAHGFQFPEKGPLRHEDFSFELDDMRRAIG
jgi:putative restriction endonuclease